HGQQEAGGLQSSDTCSSVVKTVSKRKHKLGKMDADREDGKNIGATGVNQMFVMKRDKRLRKEK
ncbi:unnamed protein product, partial [Rotaria sp. Silwood1]